MVSFYFHFEADFVDSLRCIPMVVRYKLDICGVKLKLAHWHQFSQAERLTLVELPCQTEEEVALYRQSLQDLVKLHTGQWPTDLSSDQPPAWRSLSQIPRDVEEQCQRLGINLSLQQWADLGDLQRFVLIKLSQSRHENSNFLPACREFGLVN